jgi:cysteine synthase A
VWFSGLKNLRTAQTNQTNTARQRGMPRAQQLQLAVLPSILHAVGNTPTVHLSRFTRLHEVPGRLLCKLEYLNPGASKKDRVAKQMLLDALADGRLQPAQPVVELTSGNTGTGLAIAAACLGLQFTAVMSAGNSVERAKMMRALGAEVVLVPQAPGSRPGAVSGDDIRLVQQATEQIVRQKRAFRADQFSLDSNERAHFLTTGPEIIQVAPELDAFVDFSGTCGTFSGVAKCLKAHDPRIVCCLVEPSSAAHRIQGGGYFFGPDGGALHFETLAMQRGHVDRRIVVSDALAADTARELARTEGVFGGFSTGANVAAALQVLREANRPDFSVLALACDSGLKYVSTDLY